MSKRRPGDRRASGAAAIRRRRTVGPSPRTSARAGGRRKPGWHFASARFVSGAASAEQLPRAAGPEIALAGRSNVGKSSLLNRLVARHGLARVSKTPGRTQHVNFFSIGENWVLVDLPGYGFARAPRVVQAAWQHLVEAYLTGRRALCGVVVLVDLRRGIEADDTLLLGFLRRQGIPTLLVATKSDKLRRGERRLQVRKMGSAEPGVPIVACSAVTGEGIAELRAALLRLLTGTPGEGRCSERELGA